MSAGPASSELPFHLRGNYAPVSDERTEFDLPVEGSLPSELSGLYVRNGPNPHSGSSPHWFLGDGMLHGVRIEGGRAAWYRNRYVRTRCYENDESWLQEDGSVDRTIALANTHVIAHAGRIFALVESSYPTEVTPELDTVGCFDYDGVLRTAMTAHPKLCARTGELHFFGYHFAPPYLVYHRVDPSGRLVQSEEIQVPGPTMMHDFAITDGHVLFMDLPIVFRPDLVEKEEFPYTWSDDYGARVGVMPRGGSSADVRWFEVDPCYVFHPLNAYDDGARVVVDVARYPDLWRESAQRFTSASLHRWSIDLEAEKVGEQPLDDRPIEFPRVDERRVGQPHRYGYAVSSTTSVADSTGRLVKYDLETGASRVHELPDGQSASEPVFAPASDASGEDEGWVLAYAYDPGRNASELLVIDAARFDKPAVARIQLPQRVPFGFHGSWIPDPL